MAAGIQSDYRRLIGCHKQLFNETSGMMMLYCSELKSRKAMDVAPIGQSVASR